MRVFCFVFLAMRHVGSYIPPIWDSTCSPCIGRWSLNHCTAREVPLYQPLGGFCGFPYFWWIHLKRRCGGHRSLSKCGLPWAWRPGRAGFSVSLLLAIILSSDFLKPGPGRAPQRWLYVCLLVSQRLRVLLTSKCTHTHTVTVKVTQSCQTLCNPMDCSPWNSPGQNTGVGSLSLFQVIFPTQGLSPHLPHCRRILYQLSH